LVVWFVLGVPVGRFTFAGACGGGEAVAGCRGGAVAVGWAGVNVPQPFAPQLGILKGLSQALEDAWVVLAVWEAAGGPPLGGVGRRPAG